MTRISILTISILNLIFFALMPPLHAEKRCFFCKTSSASHNLKFDLKISEDHNQIFVPVAKEVYNTNEIGPLFSEMTVRSEAYCSMRRKISEQDRDEAARFINPAFLNEYFASYNGSIQDLIAGCWNFFEMNDLRPDLDFQLVKKLYPEAAFDCYSVGFLQPYIMQSELKCSSLAMVDINWKILSAHHQFILYFNEIRDAAASLQKMNFGWFALDKAPLKARQGSVDLLCRKVQAKECEGYLQNFNNKLIFPDAVSLQLTHLYKTSYKKISEDTIRVFYLSNAIEEAYTSRDEFLHLMKNTSDSLASGQKTLFIHHVGGWKLFGIYELEKKENAFSLKTVCRDTYKSLLRSRDGIPADYETHFEKITETENPETCYGLL